MRISIEPKKDQLERALKELAHIRDGAPRAVSAALNKTIRGVKTDIVRTVTQEYCIKSRDVRGTMSIQRASPRNLRVAIHSRGAVIPLSKYPIKFRKRKQFHALKRRYGHGISPRANITKLGDVWVRVRKDSKGGIVKNAFYAKMQSEHEGVFERTSKKRLPIRELFGPAVPSMLSDMHVEEVFYDKAAARLDKNLNHEISRIEKGYGK